MTLPADSYYEDRPVQHSAQGDLHVNVPSPVAVGSELTKARGARKRPLSFLRPEPAIEGVSAPIQPLAIVCTYTCGFVAQPPGQEGYSHPMRQMAPVVPLAELVNGRGMQRTEARRLKEAGYLNGLLYVPKPPGYEPPEPKTDQEFAVDDFVVCLYAITTVHQSVLDETPRVARLSTAADKLLVAALIAHFSPSLYDPDDLEDPDMSCSWSSR